MDYAKALMLVGSVVSAALVVCFAAWGLGRIGSSSVESIARQPEASPQIRGIMLLAGALIEGVALFALVLCFLAQFKVKL